ncbi:uncharacterized protein LOC129750592 [Uranotaenia lowii]|uniref:uncharacterized protein LOC129750592 n=1 Tax=Uranotaenia lowii TaxID=190385 RepID=UPI002479F07A|nr:uncharacterized protein LOC129750592 [Uranotaenia lowii]
MNWVRSWWVVVSLVIAPPLTIAREFKRCELARELALKQVPEYQIGDWLCIAEYGSRFNTSAVNLKYKRFGGSAYYGIFQISDLYGCLKSSSICGLASCDDLKDEEVEDDIDCMLRIFAEYGRAIGDGFAAWPIHKTHCRDRAASRVPFKSCLNEEVLRFQSYYKKKKAKAKNDIFDTEQIIPVGKVYDRCELAIELRDKHRMPLEQIPTWVCIAYHESRFNTSAEGRLNADGSGDHGLFQISDIYWCSIGDQAGKACGVTCSEMRNSDISDDVRCVQIIYDEHRRISGDGFNAWTVYKPYCQELADSFVQDCFEEQPPTTVGRPRPALTAPTRPAVHKSADLTMPYGKVYDRCELANDLLYKFNFPRNQIATWVCIAYHESTFNTSAEGRLNADGSGDHGLFQISDIYWCSPPGNGYACGLSCDKLKDGDISDDVECVKKIFDEHQRLSGDGYNAWSVYQPYCKGKSDSFTQGCFGSDSVTPPIPRPAITAPTHAPGRKSQTSRGKIYDRCELAKELHLKHHYSIEDSAVWTCIAQYQSNFNTAAVGSGPGGVQYHGMFQLSDEYWCSPPGKGFVCGISCADLKDDDLTDDLACMQHIYDEHQRISGDGFNAWPSYQSACKSNALNMVKDCFEGVENVITPVTTVAPKGNVPVGKVYERCELARELYYQHGMPYDQIATWVCIAHRESNYNVSAIGRLNADGSEDHGLFQISDIYWCSPPGKGWVCGLACSDLEDNDLTDDIACMRKIFEEHTRISGDGFNAWSVYQPYCKGRSDGYILGCFDETNLSPPRPPTPLVPPSKTPKSRGKIYNRCELVNELYQKHHYSIEDAAMWTCIAQFQSNFNTAAIGSGAGGVQYHGMFQLSDEYWCSPPGKGTVCGVACSDLTDDDITDDLACIQLIFEEHQRISGDGFNAWPSYQNKCKEKAQSMVQSCFANSGGSPQIPPKRKENVGVGKVYERCELARELFYTHNLPYDQIATWVCIAHRESNYNVSAIGRLNADGSGDHGLFQISDIYWCSPPGKGWVCGVSCSDLEDNDLTDDIACMKLIFEEHTRLSGDGFNAWSVYRPYCKGRSDHYIRGCFEEENRSTKRPSVRTTRAISTSLITTKSSTTTTLKPIILSTTPRKTTQRPTIAAKSTLSTTTRRTTTRSSTPRPTAIPQKSTTSLFDFYLNHFGRPNTTPASYAPFTFRSKYTKSAITSSTSSPWSSPTVETTTRGATINKSSAKTKNYSSSARNATFDQLFNNLKH